MLLFILKQNIHILALLVQDSSDLVKLPQATPPFHFTSFTLVSGVALEIFQIRRFIFSLFSIKFIQFINLPTTYKI